MPKPTRQPTPTLPDNYTIKIERKPGESHLVQRFKLYRNGKYICKCGWKVISRGALLKLGTLRAIQDNDKLTPRAIVPGTVGALKAAIKDSGILPKPTILKPMQVPPQPIGKAFKYASLKDVKPGQVVLFNQGTHLYRARVVKTDAHGLLADYVVRGRFPHPHSLFIALDQVCLEDLTDGPNNAQQVEASTSGGTPHYKDKDSDALSLSAAYLNNLAGRMVGPMGPVAYKLKAVAKRLQFMAGKRTMEVTPYEEDTIKNLLLAFNMDDSIPVRELSSCKGKSRKAAALRILHKMDQKG